MIDDGLFYDAAADPLEDPKVKFRSEAPSLPTKSYVAVPLAWLGRVLPVARSADQLAVLMMLYRRCLRARSRTVALPNGELAALGIRRQTKYRLLARLQDIGAVAIETTTTGRAGRVTLIWFP
jgi:hypothetical protein